MYYLGIDFGTSGARACVIDPAGQVVSERQVRHPAVADAMLPQSWLATLQQLILAIPAEVRGQIAALAIDGTSSTVLLCDKRLEPVLAPLWYHDTRAQTEVAAIVARAGKHFTASATSSLAKLLWLRKQPGSEGAHILLHQSDWLSARLCGIAVSDYHNALKLAYDPEQSAYPDWLLALPESALLPPVTEPGSLVAPVTDTASRQLGLPSSCLVRAGTTDSLAATMAAGPLQEGEGVTSLGSTLALKLLSPSRIEDGQCGVYSHKYGHNWLVGGASNTGGAVLAHYFDSDDLQALSERINPDISSPLDYYPLLRKGERFPTNDPQLEPRITPIPDSPVEFLHGLLEGIARIEASGYHLFAKLGAPTLKHVVSTGGGSYNRVYRRIRQRILGVPVTRAIHTEAAYGTALLAADKIWGQT